MHAMRGVKPQAPRHGDDGHTLSTETKGEWFPPVTGGNSKGPATGTEPLQKYGNEEVVLKPEENK
jgi:hypothetical protein